MPKQNFISQKSKVKASLPLVAVAIVVIGAFIILGLIILARPVANDDSNIKTENQNQNTNEQIFLPIKNSPQIKSQPINLNLSPTSQQSEVKEELSFTFDQTYTNSEYGFSVSYPKEYTLQESKPDQALFTVSFLNLAKDLPVITIYHGRSLTGEVENALAQNISSPIKIEKKKYNNIEATQITTASSDATGAMGAKRVIWEQGNYLFELTGVKSDDFLTKMLNSFAFI